MICRSVLLLFLCGISASSIAQTTEIVAQAAGWSVYRTLPNAPRARCGVYVTHEATERHFSVNFTAGEQALVLLMAKQSWSIPENATIPVFLRIDQRTGWRIDAVGRGSSLHWQMSGNDGVSFLQEFYAGLSMAISFPQGNEQPWRFNLQGTAAMTGALARCISEISRRPSQPTQPFDPRPAEPTQPFATRPNFPQEPVPDARPADRQ